MHREYSKYLKIKAEKPQLDEDRVKAEAVYDGKFVLQINNQTNVLFSTLLLKFFKQISSI